jgi:hexosaminidase
MKRLNLLPQPRVLVPANAQHTLRPGKRIILQGAPASHLLFGAQRFQAALRERAGVDWELSATDAGPSGELGARLRVSPKQVARSQGYEIDIMPNSLAVVAHDEPGLFYGICTLIQIVEAHGADLPCLHIADWPDFAVRGVMLDISRDKVPTLDTLLALADMLAGWKINQLELYTEHTFAYRNHPQVWANASPFTGQDILILDKACRQRHIELVPNQNSFGHLTPWLTHRRYAKLAEVKDGFETPWGHHDGPFSLCPIDPGSLELIRGLYDELLPHFSSRMLNVNCDETFDVGQGRSKEEVEKRGAGRVYLDFLLKIYDEVKARGHLMQFWGDIIVQHPDLIPLLPKDATALEWGYQADHPFDANGAQFARAGIPFYVCPGTSSWCSLAGRTDNALGNLFNAAENGLKHGAVGYLNTDWGDRGHWQVLPVSYLGLAMGAAYSWALEVNRQIDVAGAVSWHAFRDPTGSMGRVAFDLGNIYKSLDIQPHNSSALFWILQWPLEKVKSYPGLTAADLRQALAAIDRAVSGLDKARMERPDAMLIVQEYQNTARLLRHACKRGLLALEKDADRAAALRRELGEDLSHIIREYRRLWLARNRPGGLVDSVGRLRAMRQDYR